MLILLPPSEGKTPPRRGRLLALQTLSSPALTQARAQLIDAVATVSAQHDAAAVLGVPAGAAAQLEWNTRVCTSPTVPAQRLYSGVLYDAFDLASLPTDALRRARRWVAVQSALFGVVRLPDRLPAYRLSMGASVPGIGPLAAYWRPLLASVMPQLARGLVIDCRSSTYAAAWTPTGEVASRWVQVLVPGATHLAKHTRGLVARRLCLAGVEPRRPEQLPGVLGGELEARVEPPARPGRPHTLHVTQRR